MDMEINSDSEATGRINKALRSGSSSGCAGRCSHYGQAEMDDEEVMTNRKSDVNAGGGRDSQVVDLARSIHDRDS
jgi:hypothetical protein